MDLEVPKTEVKKDPLSLEAYEERAEDIFSQERSGEIKSEIIDGRKMPLRMLENNLDKESKNLVFLVHGSGMNEYTWAPVLKPLEEAGLNAATFAWRGHSKSIPFDINKFAGTGLMDYVDDAQSCIDYLKNKLGLSDEDITIIGHSFGNIINSFLVRNKKYKAVMNFCAGYPNQEFFDAKGIDFNDKENFNRSLGSLWGFASYEYIKATLEEAKRGDCFESYRVAGKLEWYLSELFNLKIPEGYSGSLERLLGPSSRKAVADGLLNPPFLPIRREIIIPMHFYAATEDGMVPMETIRSLSETWGGTYEELPGPHVITYSPYVDKYIEKIINVAKNE